MKISDSEIQIEANQIIYGPYISLDASNYQIDLDFDKLDGDVYLRLTSDTGGAILPEQTLNNKEQTVFWDTAEDLNNFQIVLSTNSSAALSSVIVSKIG